MNAESYIAEIVEPTIADLESEPTSVRKAFLAAVATFHIIDYLAHPERTGNMRQFFREECPDFAIIDRVAHAFKHVEAGNQSSKENRPLSATQVIKRPPAIWGIAVFDLSRWDDSVGGVTTDDDRSVDLLDAIKRTVEFLRAKIIERQIEP